MGGWSAILMALAMLAMIPGLVLATEATPAPAPTDAPTPTAEVSPSPAPTESPTPDPAVPPPSPPAPAPAGPTTLDAVVTFSGRGYGHGVGMSQYGARGRALEGQSAATILAQYFRTAVPGSIPADSQIRVRVLKDFIASTARPLVFFARKDAWTIDGVEGTFPRDARIQVVPTATTTVGGVTRTTWLVTITDPTGAVLRSAPTRSFRLRGSSPETRFQVWSRPSSYDTYRGVVRAFLDTVKPRANVVNELPLESYLRGVVPAEMPSTWPTEALRAQSITARSFAARRLRPGVSWYDVADDTTSQVYLGVRAEKPATDAAIAATAGVVLTSGATIANTLFHSTGGGATEDNENVYVSASGAKVASAVTYLRGSMDRRPDGTAYDGTSPYATWSTRAYPIEQLSTWFASDPRTNVGTLTALDLRRRGVSGRLVSVALIGSLGTRRVSGDVFRAIFNAKRPAGDPMLRSTLFDLKPVP